MEVSPPSANAQTTDNRLYRSQLSIASRLKRINELQKTIDNQQSKLINCLNDHLDTVSSTIRHLIDNPAQSEA